MKNGLPKHKLRKLLKAKSAMKALNKQDMNEPMKNWLGKQDFLKTLNYVDRRNLFHMKNCLEALNFRMEIKAEVQEGKLCRLLIPESEAEVRSYDTWGINAKRAEETVLDPASYRACGHGDLWPICLIVLDDGARCGEYFTRQRDLVRHQRQSTASNHRVS
jgi:hypothetical protein